MRRGHSPRGAAVPDFFIVGHPKCGTTALYEMLRRHPQIYMPDCKEPWFFAPELHVRTPPRPEGTPQTLDEYLALFDAARPEQRAGEATALLPLVATAAARDRRGGSRPRASSRSCASPRASCIRCTCSSCRPTSRRSATCARRSRSRASAGREGMMPSIHLLAAGASVLRPRALRRAAAPLLRRVPAGADPGADLRRLQARQRGDGARGVCASSRSTRRFRSRRGEANPTVRPRSQRLHGARARALRGAGPALARREGDRQGLTPGGCAAGRCTRCRRRVVFAAPRPPDEGLMAELRSRFKGEVQSRSRVPGSRSPEHCGATTCQQPGSPRGARRPDHCTSRGSDSLPRRKPAASRASPPTCCTVWRASATESTASFPRASTSCRRRIIRRRRISHVVWGTSAMGVGPVVQPHAEHRVRQLAAR